MSRAISWRFFFCKPGRLGDRRHSAAWLVAVSVGRGATIAFMLASSTLFFASFQQVAWFYRSPLPAWLADWRLIG